MAPAGTVMQKPRVRGSKNRRKAWNKCDVSAVEEYLEDERFNERIGGAVKDKSDGELFVLQTTTENPPEVAKGFTLPLKCHSSIGVFSKVSTPIIIEKEHFSRKIRNARFRADEKRKKKDTRSQVSNLKEEEEEKILLRNDLFTAEIKDLWGEEEKIDPEIKDFVVYRDEITCKRTPKVPFHRFQKPSLLPPVEIPHPGASYNPSYEDHQELLSKALKVEEVKQQEELHLKRVLTDMFPTKAEAPTPESILKEMSQGLFDDEEIEEEEEDTEQPISRYRNPPITPDDRLPKSRKRKRKEMKEQLRLKKVEQLRKKQLNEVYRIRSIKSEIKQEAEVSQQRQEKRIQRKIDKMYKPLTLSKNKYEAPDLEVNLSEEICESLRTLKGEGNLLEDRYKSLQRRNLIEPRVKEKRKRKYKLKVQIKRSHRNFK